MLRTLLLSLFIHSITLCSFASALDVSEQDHVAGESTAKVTVIEYSSLSCPSCTLFHTNIYPELESKYIKTGKVKFVFRDFPLRAIDVKAAMLAHCAPQDQYFAFVHVLFKTQNSWVSETSKKLDTLKNIGRLGGLAIEKIDACFADTTLEDSIIKSRELAQKELKISSTPTFIINGKQIEGLTSKDKFFAALDVAILNAQ